MNDEQLPSELSEMAALEHGIDAQREEIEGLQVENAALRAQCPCHCHRPERYWSEADWKAYESARKSEEGR